MPCDYRRTRPWGVSNLGKAAHVFLPAAVLCLISATRAFPEENIVHAGLRPLPEPPPGKTDFIFKVTDTLSVLFDGYLEYQSAPPWIAPCDGRLAAGQDALPVSPSLAERCRFKSLNLFSKRGVTPFPTPLRYIIDTIDQCQPELRFRIAHASVRDPLFLSTWKGKGPFLAPKPATFKPKGPTRPPEATSYSIKTYAYPGDASQTLSVVHFRHVLPAMDDGYEVYPEREETVGRLYLNRGDESFFLNEPHDFGKSNLAGFMDVNGDGELDVIVGDPVVLILERYGDGYRLWWWPDYPGHGC